MSEYPLHTNCCAYIRNKTYYRTPLYVGLLRERGSSCSSRLVACGLAACSLRTASLKGFLSRYSLGLVFFLILCCVWTPVQPCHDISTFLGTLSPAGCQLTASEWAIFVAFSPAGCHSQPLNCILSFSWRFVVRGLPSYNPSFQTFLAALSPVGSCQVLLGVLRPVGCQPEALEGHV